MDNVYVVNHIIKRKLKKKEGKVFRFFMDLRAAFRQGGQKGTLESDGEKRYKD